MKWNKKSNKDCSVWNNSGFVYVLCVQWDWWVGQARHRVILKCPLMMIMCAVCECFEDDENLRQNISVTILIRDCGHQRRVSLMTIIYFEFCNWTFVRIVNILFEEKPQVKTYCLKAVEYNWREFQKQWFHECRMSNIFHLIIVVVYMDNKQKIYK